ncbi:MULTISPECIES: hypothetical protein [Shouchella]|uniref:Uncharacterized protein n=2 Tax=Shouchella TaxID=2893057 RepID=A0ABY7W8H5_9BACI|nr:MULTISPECIES: hypothetical protein [Shouchella]MED4129215.1 hypothetical protein [Shouchella miscanthi]WDF04165.1 hypothetical protein PQ477_01420 [Shouchella hunanensis]GAF23777.1 hypothetical protein JCM19047_3620 [Bacillus sp. JCM 19047]
MDRYGKWSFVLTVISSVMLSVFAVFLITGFATTYPSWVTNALGSIALLVLFASVGFSLASLGKGEKGKWKLAPWVLIGLSVVVLFILINVVYMN